MIELNDNDNINIESKEQILSLNQNKRPIVKEIKREDSIYSRRNNEPGA